MSVVRVAELVGRGVTRQVRGKLPTCKTEGLVQASRVDGALVVRACERQALGSLPTFKHEAWFQAIQRKLESGGPAVSRQDSRAACQLQHEAWFQAIKSSGALVVRMLSQARLAAATPSSIEAGSRPSKRAGALLVPAMVAARLGSLPHHSSRGLVPGQCDKAIKSLAGDSGGPACVAARSRQPATPSSTRPGSREEDGELDGFSGAMLHHSVHSLQSPVPPRAELPDRTASRDAVRALWRLVGDFDGKPRTQPGLLLSRTGLALGSTFPALRLQPAEVQYIPDIASSKDQTPFSDGVGCITVGCMQRVMSSVTAMSSGLAPPLDLSLSPTQSAGHSWVLRTGGLSPCCGPLRTFPWAIQLRVGGYKGMLSVVPDSHMPEGVLVQLRPSMRKFGSGGAECGLAGASRPVLVGRPQFTWGCQMRSSWSSKTSACRSPAAHLGVPNAVFLDLQDQCLSAARSSLVEVECAAACLARHALGAMACGQLGHELKMAASLALGASSAPAAGAAGISLVAGPGMLDPFWRSMLWACHLQEIRDVVQKARIPVPDSYVLYGVIDETGWLAEDEVFVQGRDPGLRLSPDSAPAQQQPGHAMAAGPRLRTCRAARLSLYTRTPGLHPGDLRLVRSKGKDSGMPAHWPHADSVNVANSDLDGDRYTVLAYRPLVEHLKQSEAMVFEAASPSSTIKASKQLEIQSEEVAKFYADAFANNALGQVSNAHLAQADQQEEGPSSATCLRLAELAARLVDAAKTGERVPVPKELLPDSYPDFMEKGKDKESYPSTKVLGLMYREARGVYDKLDMDPAYQQQLNDPDASSPLQRCPLTCELAAWLERGAPGSFGLLSSETSDSTSWLREEVARLHTNYCYEVSMLSLQILAADGKKLPKGAQRLLEDCSRVIDLRSPGAAPTATSPHLNDHRHQGDASVGVAQQPAASVGVAQQPAASVGVAQQTAASVGVAQQPHASVGVAQQTAASASMSQALSHPFSAEALAPLALDKAPLNANCGLGFGWLGHEFLTAWESQNRQLLQAGHVPPFSSGSTEGAAGSAQGDAGGGETAVGVGTMDPGRELGIQAGRELVNWFKAESSAIYGAVMRRVAFGRSLSAQDGSTSSNFPTLVSASVFEPLLHDSTFTEDFPGLEVSGSVLRWNIKSEDQTSAAQDHRLPVSLAPPTSRETFSFDLSLRLPGLAKSAYICSALQRTPAVLPVLRCLLAWMHMHGVVAGGRGPWLGPSALVLLCLHIWELQQQGWLRVLPSGVVTVTPVGQQHKRARSSGCSSSGSSTALLVDTWNKACPRVATSVTPSMLLASHLLPLSGFVASSSGTSRTAGSGGGGNQSHSSEPHHVGLDPPGAYHGLTMGIEDNQACADPKASGGALVTILAVLADRSMLSFPEDEQLSQAGSGSGSGTSSCPPKLSLTPFPSTYAFNRLLHNIKPGLWKPYPLTWDGRGVATQAALYLLHVMCAGGSVLGNLDAASQLGHSLSGGVAMELVLDTECYSAYLCGLNLNAEGYLGHRRTRNSRPSPTELAALLEAQCGAPSDVQIQSSPPNDHPHACHRPFQCRATALLFEGASAASAMAPLQLGRKSLAVYLSTLAFSDKHSGGGGDAVGLRSYTGRVQLEHHRFAEEKLLHTLHLVSPSTHSMPASAAARSTLAHCPLLPPVPPALTPALQRLQALLFARCLTLPEQLSEAFPRHLLMECSLRAVTRFGVYYVMNATQGLGASGMPLDAVTGSGLEAVVLSAFSTGFEPGSQLEGAVSFGESLARVLKEAGFVAIAPVWDTSSPQAGSGFGAGSGPGARSGAGLGSGAGSGPGAGSGAGFGSGAGTGAGSGVSDRVPWNPHSTLCGVHNFYITCTVLRGRHEYKLNLASFPSNSAGYPMSDQDQGPRPDVPHARFMLELRPAVDDTDMGPFLEAMRTRQQILAVPEIAGSSTQATGDPAFPSWARLYGSSSTDARGELFRVVPGPHCAASDFLNIRMHHQQSFALGGGSAGNTGSTLAGEGGQDWQVVVVIDEVLEWSRPTLDGVYRAEDLSFDSAATRRIEVEMHLRGGSAEQWPWLPIAAHHTDHGGGRQAVPKATSLRVLFYSSRFSAKRSTPTAPVPYLSLSSLSLSHPSIPSAASRSVPTMPRPSASSSLDVLPDEILLQVFTHLIDAGPPVDTDEDREDPWYIRNLPFRNSDREDQPNPGMRAYPFLGQLKPEIKGKLNSIPLAPSRILLGTKTALAEPVTVVPGVGPAHSSSN
eukprot:gene6643-3300_t